MKGLDKYSDFLFYNANDGKIKVQVIVGEDTVWATQRSMAEIFDVEVPAVSKHISNIYTEGELNEDATVSKMEIVQIEGSREVRRLVDFYNLDVIIAVGYRVNSYSATKFRIWATAILKEYLIKGFALDDERLKQGNRLFNKDYFKELLERIREIRASEKMFYEKIRDIYATSVDYDKSSPKTSKFFATVQNKLEFAIVGKTSAEIIKDRADSQQPHMNLKTFKNSKKDGGDIQKCDVTVAKNYLSEDEIRKLNTLVNMFLDYAELQAERNRIMKMKDWSERLDSFLTFNEYDVLDNAGKVSKDVADNYATKEYEKYKVLRDKSNDIAFSSLVSQIKSTGRLPAESSISKLETNSFDQQLQGLLKVPPPKKEK